jgi:beta-lactamase superfamily II metal-dependent hydrolase
MTMRFEFLPAFKGDSFLIHGGTADEPVLIVVDGGPKGTYEQHLRKRLMAIRDERNLQQGEPLVINLVIVSHVDDDHINGIIDLFEEIRDDVMARRPPLFEVRELWHNSFDEIIRNGEVRGRTEQFGAASVAGAIELDEDEDEDEPDSDDAARVRQGLQHDAALILQSVEQGHKLRELALSNELRITINGDSDGLMMTRAGERTVHEVGGIRFTLVGPREEELAALEEKHDEWLRRRQQQGKPITPGSLLQSLSDESVANLSSIVLLAERDGKTALLTGDARSDFVVKGLEESGLLSPGGGLEVGLLKMPHHGSDRNVDEAFLERVTAPRYLFTGNGEHGNPERATFDMLIAARPQAAMEFYLTYPIETIDRIRKAEHEKARAKDLAKQTAGRMKPPRQPLAEWSDDAHSVQAAKRLAPSNVKFIEPSGAFVRL